ncbi:hypothetical protein GCM10022403_092340 [Streptomyces coacervatus]|uniref:Uncharacterized protein n=1 Tax=Streptomyces coacervatus TaxID=647381 RepID=A0ABP7JJK7_9ACTN
MAGSSLGGMQPDGAKHPAQWSQLAATATVSPDRHLLEGSHTPARSTRVRPYLLCEASGAAVTTVASNSS